MSVAILLACVSLIFWKSQKGRTKVVRKSSSTLSLYLALLAIVSFGIFYSLPIATTIYGDEVQISKESISQFDASWFTDVITPNLLEGKEALTMAIHRSLAVIFSQPLAQIFKLVSALCGSMFVMLWGRFVFKSPLNDDLRIALFVAGISGGAMLVFFGHVEVYALPMLGSLIFLLHGIRVLKRESPFWSLLLLFVVIVKLHIITILFLPALIYLFLELRRQDTDAVGQSAVSWKQVILFIVIPSLLIGLGAYFFLFHSYDEPYIGDKARQLQQSFLPLTSGAPPYDHYSLLAPAHLLDLVNVFLFVGGPAFLLLIGMLSFARKSLKWETQLVKYAGLAFLFPFIFFCAMNPTLSIARDWDIYALIYPPLLLLLFALLFERSSEHERLSIWNGYLKRAALAFGLLSLPAIIVNIRPELISSRLFDLSDHVYRTYYAGSHYFMSAALEASTPEDRSEKLSTLLKSIRAVHRGANDEEGAGMLVWRAKLLLADQQIDSAMITLKEARVWDPRLPAVLQSLELVAGAIGDTAAARGYLQELVKLDPSKENVDRLKNLH